MLGWKKGRIDGRIGTMKEGNRRRKENETHLKVGLRARKLTAKKRRRFKTQTVKRPTSLRLSVKWSNGHA